MVVVGVLAAPVVVTAPATGPAARAAEQPTVEVWSSPTGTRVDGVNREQVAADQVVEVRWRGFTPNSLVVLSQCVSPIRAENEYGWAKSPWRSLTNCAHQTRLYATTGADGTGKASYSMKVGDLSPVTVSQTVSNPYGSQRLVCNGGKATGIEAACVVAVSECEWDQPIDLAKPDPSGPWTLVPRAPKAGVKDPAVGAASAQIRFGNNPDGTPVTTVFPAPPPHKIPVEGEPPVLPPITGTPVGAPIQGAGSVNTATVLNSWLVGIRRQPQPADVDFVRGTSLFGAEQLKAGFQSRFTTGADFAVTGMPFTRGDVGGDVVYAPISLTALAVANSVEYGGLGLNEMRMSPDVLALMLAGGDGVNSGEWGDVLGNSPTAVDNHGCGLPVLDAMQILRSGASAQNQLLSSWFQATLPAGQFGKLFVSTPGGPELLPVRAYDSRSAENGSQTAYEIATNFGKATDPDPTDDSIPSTAIVEKQKEGALGYLDVTEVNAERALGIALPASPLKNAAGDYIAPTKDAILAAYPTMKHNADGTVTATFGDTSKAGAYPLPMVHYIAVPKTDAKGVNPLPIAKRKTLAALIEYIVGASGQQQVTDLGAPALPDDLRQQALAVATMLKRADPPKSSSGSHGKSGSSSSGSGGLGGSGTPTGDSPAGVPVAASATPTASAAPAATVPTIAPVALHNESTRGGKIPAAAGAISITIIVILGGVLLASGGAWRGYLVWRRLAARRAGQP